MQFHGSLFAIPETRIAGPPSKITALQAGRVRWGLKTIQPSPTEWYMQTASLHIWAFVRKGPIKIGRHQLWPPKQFRRFSTKGDDTEAIMSHPVYFQGGFPHHGSELSTQRFRNSIGPPNASEAPFHNTAGVSTSDANAPRSTVISAAKRASPWRPSPNLKRGLAGEVDILRIPRFSRSKLDSPTT